MQLTKERRLIKNEVLREIITVFRQMPPGTRLVALETMRALGNAAPREDAKVALSLVKL